MMNPAPLHFTLQARAFHDLVRKTIEQRKEILADLAYAQERAQRTYEVTQQNPAVTSGNASGRAQDQKPAGAISFIGAELTVLKPGEHDRYPDGRARALEPT